MSISQIIKAINSGKIDQIQKIKHHSISDIEREVYRENPIDAPVILGNFWEVPTKLAYFCHLRGPGRLVEIGRAESSVIRTITGFNQIKGGTSAGASVDICFEFRSSSKDLHSVVGYTVKRKKNKTLRKSSLELDAVITKLDIAYSDYNVPMNSKILVHKQDQCQKIINSKELNPKIHQIEDIIEVQQDWANVISLFERWNWDLNSLQKKLQENYCETFSPRNEQSMAEEQALKVFKEKLRNNFLINAVMRYGKCFVAGRIAKRLKAKKILILTYKPTTSSEWRECFSNHIDFLGWNFLSAWDFSKDKPIEFEDSNEPQVLFASLQDFGDFKKKSKWSKISGIRFDLVIIDEYHFGVEADSERAQNALKLIKYDFSVALSGTPFDALLNGSFDSYNTFTWSYIDEQKARSEEELGGWKTEVYRWLCKMNLFRFKISDKVKELMLESGLYPPEEMITMTKLFATGEDDKMLDEPAVREFLNQMGRGGGYRKSISPYQNPKIRGGLNHTLWFLPSVASVKALKQLLETHFFFKDYEVIIASGEDRVENVEEIRSRIRKVEKSITLSCQRFDTGSTVPQWRAVFMLNDTKSPERYFQSIFRAKSPWKEGRKEDCYVIDFNPTRVIIMAYEYCLKIAKPGDSPRTTVKEFLDFAPIFDADDNSTEKMDVNKFMKEFVTVGDVTKSFGSTRLLNMNNWIPDLSKILDGLEKGSGKTEIDVGNNGIEPGKNTTGGERSKKPKRPKTEEEKMKEDKEKARELLRQLPKFFTLAKQSGITSAEDLSKNLHKMFVNI